jgi:hypothetical protein
MDPDERVREKTEEALDEIQRREVVAERPTSTQGGLS